MADIKVRDVFSMCNTMIPKISLYDERKILVFEKENGVPLGYCGFMTCYVDFIHEISASEIMLSIH